MMFGLKPLFSMVNYLTSSKSFNHNSYQTKSISFHKYSKSKFLTD